MRAPARAIVAALTEQPMTLVELSELLQYPPYRVLGFVTEARAEGARITALRDTSVEWVPVRAQPGTGAWTTTYAVRSGNTNGREPLTASPTMEDNHSR